MTMPDGVNCYVRVELLVEVAVHARGVDHDHCEIDNDSGDRNRIDNPIDCFSNWSVINDGNDSFVGHATPTENKQRR